MGNNPLAARNERRRQACGLHLLNSRAYWNETVSFRSGKIEAVGAHPIFVWPKRIGCHGGCSRDAGAGTRPRRAIVEELDPVNGRMSGRMRQFSPGLQPCRFDQLRAQSQLSGEAGRRTNRAYPVNADTHYIYSGRRGAPTPYQPLVGLEGDLDQGADRTTRRADRDRSRRPERLLRANCGRSRTTGRTCHMQPFAAFPARSGMAGERQRRHSVPAVGGRPASSRSSRHRQIPLTRAWRRPELVHARPHRSNYRSTTELGL